MEINISSKPVQRDILFVESEMDGLHYAVMIAKFIKIKIHGKGIFSMPTVYECLDYSNMNGMINLSDIVKIMSHNYVFGFH